MEVDGQVDALRAQLWDVRTEFTAASAAAEAGAAAATASVIGAQEEAAAATQRAEHATAERQAAERSAEEAAMQLRTQLVAMQVELDAARATPVRNEADTSELQSVLVETRARAEGLAAQLAERDALLLELQLHPGADKSDEGDPLAPAEMEAVRLRQSLAASEAAALASQVEHARQLAATAADQTAAVVTT